MIKSMIFLLPFFLVTAGCSTSPEPDYFTLAPVSGSVVTEVHYSVKIQRPLLAGYLDRPEIVQQDSDYDIQIDDNRRWAEPLDSMFERVLLQDLQQRLPAATILDEDTAILSDPRVAIAINIQQFNKTAHDEVSLQGELNVRDKGTHEQPPSIHIQYTSDTNSGNVPQNLSMLIGKLADSIAILLHNQFIQGNSITPQKPTLLPE